MPPSAGLLQTHRFMYWTVTCNPLRSAYRVNCMIGGDGLARGYLHRPDLTAEKFIPDPFGRSPARGCTRLGTWSATCPTEPSSIWDAWTTR